MVTVFQRWTIDHGLPMKAAVVDDNAATKRLATRARARAYEHMHANIVNSINGHHLKQRSAFVTFFKHCAHLPLGSGFSVVPENRANFAMHETSYGAFR